MSCHRGHLRFSELGLRFSTVFCQLIFHKSHGFGNTGDYVSKAQPDDKLVRLGPLLDTALAGGRHLKVAPCSEHGDSYVAINYWCMIPLLVSATLVSGHMHRLRNRVRPPHSRMEGKRRPIRMATMMLLIATMINLLQSAVPCLLKYPS